MPRGCPPGVLCVETATIVYLIIGILAIFAIMYTINNNPILFEEYNRLSSFINSIQLKLQDDKLDDDDVNELLQKRMLAYNELKTGNLIKIDPLNHIVRKMH